MRTQGLGDEGPIDRAGVLGGGGSTQALPWQVRLLVDDDVSPTAHIPFAPYGNGFRTTLMHEIAQAITGTGGFALPVVNGHLVWIEGAFTAGALTGCEVKSGVDAPTIEWTGTLVDGTLLQTKFRFALGWVGDPPEAATPANGFPFKSATKFFYQLPVGRLHLSRRNINGNPYIYPEVY